MFQKTPLKRVLYSRTLTLVMVGVFAVVSFLSGTLLFRPAQTLAANATNNTINFQARLQTAAGSIVPDGNYNVQFKLYDGDTAGGTAGSGAGYAGTNLWTETWQNSNSQGVRVVNGYLTASLGSITAFPNTINWDQGLWITMNIGGTTTGASPTWDGEMLGTGNLRLKLTAVPYALRAGQLAQFNSGTGFTSTLSIIQPTGGNQTFQIADQGAAGTYTLLTQNQANSGFIQNQNASPQTGANFNIAGTGTAATLNATSAIQLNGTTIVTSTKVLQGVTANTSILTSGTLGVARGGTGATTLTAGGVLLGNGTSAITATGVLTNGQLLIGDGAGAPTVGTLSGSGGITITNGAGTITIGTDTTICTTSGNCAGTGGDITGSGTTNTIPMFTSAGGIGNSIMSQSGTSAINVSGNIVATMADVNNLETNGTVRLDATGLLQNVTADAGILTSGTVNSARLSGSYTGITGVGTLTAGTWNANTISVQYGGTGVNGSTAANGQLLIGNGTGYSLGTLTAGSGVTITNSAGGITIASSGVTGTAGGDLSGTYPNPTVAKIQGTALNISGPTSGQILVWNGTGWTNTAVSGDITISSTGVATIGTGKVTSADILDGAVTSTDIANNTITNSDIASGAFGNITGTGALASGSIASGFGTISTGNTITGTTVNGTTGINTGSGSGTQRIDASGNLVNIGTISASGDLTIQGTGTSTFAGNLSVSGRVTANTLIQTAGWTDLAPSAVVTTTGGSMSNGGPTTRGNGSYWTANATGQQLTADLGTTIGVTGISFGTNYRTDNRFIPADFTIDYSTDNATWTNIVTVTGNTNTAPLFTPGGVNARYIRLTVNAFQSGQTTANIAGLQILTSAGSALGGSNLIGLSQYGTIYTNNAFLTTSGNFGIGTTAPGYKLDVQGGNGINSAQGYWVGGTQVLTSGRVLQNVTADAGILTSGTIGSSLLSGSYTGITGVGTLTVGTWNASMIGAQYGGTGVNGSTAANGQLLIGNGTGYTLGTLTAGSGISITNAAGSITINASGSGGTAGGDLTGTYPNPTIAKLQGGTLTITTPAGGNFLQYNGTAWVNQSVSGDITISSAGVAAISTGKVTSAMILDGTVSGTDITNNTITNSDVQSGAFSNITGVGTLSGLSIATNNTFTNAGSTLNTAVALANFTANAAIGTAAATVDSATAFTINQTTASITLTLPSPTVTTAGRIAYVSNIGTASFTMYGVVVSAGNTAVYLWNGTAWTSAGIDGSGANYIQNQNASTQTANFKINGTGVAGTLQATTLQGNTLDVLSGTTLGIAGTTATTINIATNAIAHTIAIGNGAAVQGITIGSTNSTSSLLLQAGTGNLQIQTQGGTLGIGNNAVAQTITIGNATGATSVALNAGTGGISIGNNGIANTIQIGTTTGAVAQTVNLGNNATASSTTTVNIGSQVGTGATNINAGTGDINLTTNNAGAGTFVKTLTNTTQAFTIQNASGTAMMTADTTNGNLATALGNLTVGSLLPPGGLALAGATTAGSLPSGATYTYRVATFYGTSISYAGTPSPASYTTTTATSKVTLSWTSVSGAAGYYVYRQKNGTGSWFRVTVNGGSSTGYTDTSDTNWTGTDYTTAATGTSGNSGNITLNTGSAIHLDTNSAGSMIWNDSANNFTIANYNANKGIILQSDSFQFIDTTGYNNDLTITNTGATTFKNRVNSTAAFQVQDSSGNKILTIDSTNLNVGIGISGADSDARLLSYVGGGTNTVIRGNTVGTGDLLQLQNTSSNVLSVSSTGATLSKNSVNSTAAFQIQNASGTSLLNADTTGMQITVGGSLTVNNGITVLASDANQIRLVNGNYGSIFRQDGANFYYLTTNSGDPYGGWSGLRPLQINNGSGEVYLGGSTVDIQNGGNVGIGMAPDVYRLEVANNIHICGSGTNCSNGQIFFGDNAVQYGSTASDANNPWIGETNGDSDILLLSGSAGIEFQTSYTSDTYHYSSFYNESGDFCIDTTSCSHHLGVNGSAMSSTGWATGTPDIAEYITTAPDVSAYDVVAADPNNYESVVKATGSLRNAMVGAISDGTSGFQMQNAHYGQAFDGNVDPTDPNAKPMTLAGRIPVHVTNENGAIHPGDYLTVSDTVPGYAMKATHAGATIGKALGFYDGTSGNTVLALINLSYYDPNDGNHIQSQSGSFDTLQAGSASFGSLNVSGAATISSLTVTGNTLLQGDLTVSGKTNVGTITVNGHIITSGQAPVITVGDAAGKPKLINGVADSSTAAMVSVEGTDSAGTISLTTGDNSITSGALAHLNFAQNFTTSYNVVVSASNSPASKAGAYVLKTATGFDLVTDGTLSPATNYQFDYIVLGSQTTAAP